MSIVAISFIESVLYYLCMLTVPVKLLDAEYSKIKICVSFLIFVPVIIAAIFCGQEIMITIHAIFQFIEIITAKLCIKKVKILSIASVYCFLFMLNVMLESVPGIFLTLNKPQSCIVEFSVNIITFIACMIICFTKIRNKTVQILKFTSKIVKGLILSLLFFCAILVTAITNEIFYSTPHKLILVIRITFVIIIVLLFFALPVMIVYSMTNKHIKNQAENYEKQINAQSEHYALLSESNFELRRFRHDYKNMCIGLSKLISEGKNDEALKMLEKQNLDISPSLTLFDTGNGIVDALLTDKQKQADKINTRISFEGGIPSDAMKPTDLCVIFGNTLDNAIEACQKIETTDEKIISVSCFCRSGFVFIRISNPVAQKVRLSGHIPETTKTDKNHHGLGLYSLDKIVRQYDGEVSFECDDKEFCVSVEFALF
ncbi:MAG: GHKL domain-containing protein [Clostridia bacterium]|nr:GHKL domain-containing protein [Clostridia bacterium]